VLTILSASYWVVKPILTFYLSEKIESILQSITNNQTSIDSISFDLVPLRLKLNKLITYQPTNEIESFEIAEASLNVDLLSLFKGKRGFLTAKVSNLNFKLNIDKIKKTEGHFDVPMDEIFQWSRQIPLASFEIENLIGHIFSETHHYSINLNEINLQIDNFGSKIKTYLNKSDILLSYDKYTFPLILTSDVEIRQDQIEIIHLFVQDEENLPLLKAGFKFLNPKQIFYKVNGTGYLKSDFELKNFENELRVLIGTESGIFSGQINANLNFLVKDNELEKIPDADFFWNTLVFNNWNLGSSKANATYADKIIKLDQVSIDHIAAKIKAAKISYNSDLDQVTSTINIDSFHLQNLFSTFQLEKIPVWTEANGHLNCEGKLKKFKLNCKGKIQSDQLTIKTDYHEVDSLIQLKKIEVDGMATVDLSQIELETNLRLGTSSRGSAKGRINFKDGFDFKYSADQLLGSDIDNLANMGLFGNFKLVGETKGDSSRGTFQINLDSNQSGLYKTHLGDVKAYLSYQDKQLQVDNINGKTGVSIYSGAVGLDFHSSKLNLRVASTNFDLKDVHDIVKDHNIPLPDLQGLGVLDFEYDGALSFKTGSVNTKGYFKNLQIGKEKFESFDFEMKDQDGKNLIKVAKFTKGRGLISFSGHLTKNFEHQIEIFGRNLLFEESQTVTELFNNIAGVTQFDLKMTGPFFHPEFNLRGTIDKLVVSSQELEKSEFDITIKNNLIEAKASLFANQILGKLSWPLSSNTAFNADLNFNNWVFSKSFALFGSDSVLAEYKSNLTGTINVKSDTGSLDNVFGKVSLNSFHLSRNQLQIKNVKKMEVDIENGTYYLKNWNFAGDDTQLEISSDGFRLDKLNLKVNSKLNMRLLQIFLPFLNDIAGRLQSSMQISGDFKKPEILGDAQIVNAFVKPKALPHTIEKINIAIEFSQSKVDISKISAELGGGSISGQGQIEILEAKKLNTLISLSLKDVNLNIPDRVKTLGDGDLNLTGSWFPYLLSGSYRIKDGFMDKEFGNSDNSAGSNFSIYLPKNILESTFEPILLDLKIQLQKPLVLKNSIVDGQVNGDLLVKGFPSQPRLIGQLQFREPSVLFFRDVPFEIISSNIEFKDEININPNLYISARARKSDYDVSMLVQGSGKSPIVRLNSTPPLSEQDLISLLALGVTADKLDQKIVSREQESNLNYAIGSAILANNPLTKNIQKKLGIELQFSTNYDNTKNVAQQKATVSKKIANKVTLSASQTRGEQLSREATIQYSINPQLSAIGIWENKEVNSDSNQIDTNKKTDPNIFGIDLEFKREFK